MATRADALLAAFANGDFEYVWSARDSARDSAPTVDPAVGLAIAQSGWRLGRYPAALARFVDLAERYPDATELTLRAAQASIQCARFDEADRLLAGVPDAIERAPGIALIAALRCVDRGEEGRALAMVEALGARWPGFAEAAIGAAWLGHVRHGRALDPRRATNDRQRAQLDAARFQRERIADARLFGTAPALLTAALDAASREGLVLEFGVFRGRSLAQIARAVAPSAAYGFDSFEGLPEDWTDSDRRGAYTTHGALPEALPDNARLEIGWFDATLGPFLARHDNAVRFAHIDCDLGSATMTVLDALAPRLVAGSVIVFDDLLGYAGWERHEWAAWHACAERARIRYQWLGFTWLGREAALVINA